VIKFFIFKEYYELEELIANTIEMYIYMAYFNKMEKNFRDCFLFLHFGN